jgi:hypothetical protein
MKKITKLFLVILSAASLNISAFAGELSVTGGVTATTSLSGEGGSGKALGVSNELQFNANGELDSGIAWKWQTEYDNAGGVNDDTRLELSTASFGTLGFYISENDISSKLGYGIGALGVGSDYSGPTTVQWGATMNSYNNFGYSLPADLLPYGITAKFAYAPNLSDTQGASAKNKGAVQNRAVGTKAFATRIDANPIDGLTMGIDGMTTQGLDKTVSKYQQASAGAFVKYQIGSFTLGAAKTGYQPTKDATTVTGTTTFDTDQYGVQFALNDAISLSYSEEVSTQRVGAQLAGQAVLTPAAEIEMSVKHMQAAYTVGGATLGIAIADASNSDYVTANDEKTTMLSLAIAF